MKKENEAQETALAVRPDPIVMPAVSPQQAVDAWKAYQDLKSKIVEKSDVQVIQGHDFLKKSYWRKLATFFNLSVDVVKEEKWHDDDEGWVFDYTCKATAPNGRSVIGTGSCTQNEKQQGNTLHNTRSTAETRAYNRAVSNLVAGGEVSADEMVDKKGGKKGEWDQAPSSYSQKGRKVVEPLSDEAQARAKEIGDMIMEMVEGDKKRAKDALMSYTAWPEKKFKGHDSITKLTEGQLMKGPLFDQVSEEYNYWKKRDE